VKKDLTYSEAFSKLQELVEQLEDGDIQLDELSANVKQANELIAICEIKLRSIETETRDAAKTAATRSRKKDDDAEATLSAT
jgi:exodeoxyribonuclease VII small subunit